MPLAIAGAALAATSFSVTAAGIAITGFSWAAFAGNLVLGAISSALTSKSQKKGIDNNANLSGGSTVTVRQSDLTRQHVRGHTRITRGYAHMSSTGLNGVLHVIVMLCEGPLRSINEIWLNDYCIPADWIDAGGNITQGRYAGFMTIRKHLGEDTQLADSAAVANMPDWTTNHRLRGIAYLYITMTKNQDVYPTGVPNISAIVEGKPLYDYRIDAERWSTNIALYVTEYMRNSEYGFAAFDDDVDPVNMAAQANICDEIVDTAALDHNFVSTDIATNIITLGGDLLQFQFGDRVQLIGGTAPGGLTLGTNYYVIPYQILTTPRILLATSLNNAMDKIAVDLSSGGSGFVVRKTGEPRYHGGGIFDTETNLSSTLNDMVTSAAGRAICIGGFWTQLVGAWRSPEVEFGIGDVRGNGLSFVNSLSMSDSYNSVKGKFVSSLSLFQQTDYPSAFYQEFIDQDNGLPAPKEINLPFTNRPTTAQRIAKIELFKGRQDIVVKATMSTKALQVQPGDVVSLTVERYGWEENYFEVTEFGFNSAEGILTVDLTLRETAQEIFDWSQGEAIDYDPAPNTTLPNPFVVQVPTGVKYNSTATGTAGGDLVYTMQLEWDQHPDANVVERGGFELQYKKSDDTEWLPSFFVDGHLLKSKVLDSTVGIAYDLRIRARNNLGVRSQWVTILSATVGSSGGVGTTLDYHLVSDTITTFLDYNFVADTIGTTYDYGFVE